jgi:hypothetical protein
MRYRVRSTGALLSLFLSVLLSSSGSSANPALHQSAVDSQIQSQIKGRVVYVRACLKTKLCSCMTEAKMEGP